ncbi:MAG: thioredoxin family protein [Fibrobacter sp.]|nr:thioredoxin family protein [Fibrobacter sp.]
MTKCKWALALLFVVLYSQFAFGAEVKTRLVKWRDYTAALDSAKEHPKLIFVDLYADWCVPCRIMDKNVYSDPTVASLLNNQFYAVKLDADSQDTIVCDGQKKTVQRCYFDVWELSALPAFVLVAPKGLSILTVTDSMSPQEMQVLLYQFLEKEKEWIAR